MAKCPICNDSGKRPGSDYLDCGCTASAERAELNTFAEDQISTSNPEERDWLIYTRAKALGRASALAELHPLWLAEKERADRAEARIAELEAQLAAASAPAELPIKTWQERAEESGADALTVDQCMKLAETEIAELRAALSRPVVAIPVNWKEQALRQYRHNDGSEGLVFAYDFEVINRLLAAAPSSPQPAIVKADTPEYTQYECYHCGSGCTVHKLQPVAKVLTDTRIEEIAIDTGGSGWIIVFARAIEAEILAASTPTTLTEKKECQ